MSFAADKIPPVNACRDLIRQVESLRRSIEQQAELGKTALRRLRPEVQRSAENLLHYLALRNRDLRPLP